MARIAERVYTRAEDIERLEALTRQLDSEMEVELELDDGSRVRGVVAERPSVQQFLDPQGHEGTNGSFRFDDRNGQRRFIALDRVRHVLRLGSA